MKNVSPEYQEQLNNLASNLYEPFRRHVDPTLLSILEDYELRCLRYEREQRAAHYAAELSSRWHGTEGFTVDL